MSDPPPRAQEAVVARLAADLKLDPTRVERALGLLDRGLPVPFLARYRREQVGGLDEDALTQIRERAVDLRELESRRAFVLRAVAEGGDAPPKLLRRIRRCRERTELEDLYLPYRPRRRTRGSLAAERGLGPLADALLDPKADAPAELAAKFVDEGREVLDVEAALRGATDILAERFAESVDVRAQLFRMVSKDGVLKALPPPGEAEIPRRFSRFRGYEERISRIPPHRYLALRRAEKEGAIATRIDYDETKVLAEIARRSFPGERPEPQRELLEGAAHEAVRRVIAPAVLTEVRRASKVHADRDAVRVFTRNLADLLLMPPAGARRTMGLDPAPRGAVHLACVGERGEPLGHERIKPFAKDEARAAAAGETVVRLCRAHEVEVVALGNGGGSHECELFLARALEELGEGAPAVVVVDEAGTGAYASGPVGRAELPGLPVPARAAVSLARRLQDPLAELVKIDPKQIGVGQYQNDVDQALLRRALHDVVEHCVNSVGVDLNRAPLHQLAAVCGLGSGRARAIVQRRGRRGLFRSLLELKEVAAIDDESWRRAVGFLRIHGGENPLDATGVHVEDYPLVERIASAVGVAPGELIGNADKLAGVAVEDFADKEHSPPAVASVLAELLEGGRDPRPPLQIVRRTPTVRSLDQLRAGMTVDGRVTNVTAFGAFVDVGVGQDGLVHVSELSDRFVKDPTRVVHVGQVVRARVLSVDPETRRIGLTMKQGHGGGRERGERERGGRERGERERGGERSRRGAPGPRRSRRDGGPRPRKRERRPDPEPAPPPQAPAAGEAEPASDPVPNGMTEEEFLQHKLEELRRRFR